MFKRLILSLALAAGLLSPSYGAGTVPGFSLTVQYDNSGNLARGCQLNVIQAGTTSTPQIAYQDSALTIPAPGGNVLTCDGNARLPQFFLADGQIKLRLSDKNGTQIFAQDNLLVVGPSTGGGGGGGTVDPTTILQTGDIKAVYGTGVVTGFVRLNGRTIGSASSGATERANADTQALFQYLWSADVNLPVSTGRGVSANADWVANKQLTLPDARDRALAGLGDMGNTDAARFTATYFGPTAVNAAGNNCAPTSLGCASGRESQTLTLGQAPAGITSSGGVSVTTTSDQGGIGSNNNSGSARVNNPSDNSFGAANISGVPVTIGQITATGSGSASVASNNTGGAAHPIVSPVLLVTLYQKL